jgi:GntR family transcriptional regulator
MPFKQLSLGDVPLARLAQDSPVPLYHQIEVDLRQLISRGTLKPDDLLPPEHELCKGYGVGRHTVRMALARLTADGLIERQAGRGTFVKPLSDKHKFHLDRSFTRQMADIGVLARSRVLYAGPPTASLPPEVEAAGTRFFVLERLRLGGDEPIGLQSTVVVADACPGIERIDFNTRSLYDVLGREYNLEVTRLTHAISATVATERQAGLLDVAPGSPLLVVKTAAYLDSGQVIEFTTSDYRADKYEYTTTDTYPHAYATKARLAALR